MKFIDHLIDKAVVRHLEGTKNLYVEKETIPSAQIIPCTPEKVKASLTLHDFPFGNNLVEFDQKPVLEDIIAKMDELIQKVADLESKVNPVTPAETPIQ